MVQERFNTDWIAQNGFGVVLPSLREIGERGLDDARSRTVRSPACERERHSTTVRYLKSPKSSRR